MMQGGQMMAVVGRGEAVGEKRNNQIDTMMVEVGYSGCYNGQWCLSLVAMDGGEAKARWAGGLRCEAIRQRTTQQEGGGG